MADNRDVRIPIRGEDSGRRKINGVVAATVVAAAAALGLTYFLVPKVDRAIQRQPTKQATLVFLDEEGDVKRVETRQVPANDPAVREPRNTRAQRLIVREGEASRVIDADTAEEYRQASGTPGEFSDLVNAQDAERYDGKFLRLESVNVVTVPGDKIFTIGSSESESMLVRIDEPTNPGAKPENVLVVRPNQQAFVVGRLAKYPGDQAARGWGLTPEEAQRFSNKKLYLKAILVEVLSEE